MTSNNKNSYPLIIIGAGIAGTIAARCVAESGIRAALVSSAKFFSGSSFYPGTWGFGLIGPKNEGDIDKLCEGIATIGQYTNYPSLTRHFASSILPSINELERYKVELQKPSANAQNQEEFIPCFDSEWRTWRGITQDSYKSALEVSIQDSQLDLFEYHELIDIVVENEEVRGVVLFDAHAKRITTLSCKALILATGGFSGLFNRSLGSKLANGVAQGIMINKGALCTNLEFMQIMQGYCKPKSGIVFNEKIYKNISLTTPQGDDILQLYQENQSINVQDLIYPNQELLNERSKHGPFTCERISAIVDRAISSYVHRGVLAQFNSKDNTPEFVETYFSWLENSQGISRHDSIELAPYAHAANGGLLINEAAQTSLKGIWAAGEVTGGMHGADRIGGLASANALVFGLVAAREAMKYCLNCQDSIGANESKNLHTLSDIKLAYSPHFKEHRKTLKDIMTSSFMLERNESQLQQALNTLQNLLSGYTQVALAELSNKADLAHAQSVYSQITSAYALCFSALMRDESRGSHDRADYRAHKHSLACPQVICKGKNQDDSLTLESCFDSDYACLASIRW